MPDDLDTVAPPVDPRVLREGMVVWLRSGGIPMTVEDPNPDEHGEIGLVFWEGPIIMQQRLRPSLLTRFGG